MDYQSHLYSNSPDSELIKLDRVQWAAIRIALGMKSTHTKALEAEADIMPLKIRRQLMSDKVISKLFSAKKSHIHPLIQSIHPSLAPESQPDIQKNTIHNSVEKIRNIQIQSNDIHPSLKFNPFSNYTIPTVILPNLTKNSENVESTVRKILTKFSDFCRVYTDGSKTADKVGAAIWIPQYNIEGTFPLNQKASIYSAETRAIREALEFALILEEHKFIIISDSKSALTALMNFPTKKSSPEIYLLKNLLYRIQEANKEVNFLWVPSHAGVEGNDHVDALAKSVPIPHHPIEVYHRDLHESFKHDSIQRWQLDWNESNLGRYFFDIKPNINKQPWFYDCLLNRGSIATITRLRLNHNSTNYHLHRKNIISSPICECGIQIDTADHTLFECVLTDSSHRKPFIQLMEREFNIRPINIKVILKNGHPRVYAALANYLKKTGIKL